MLNATAKQDRDLQQRLTAAGWMSGLSWLPCRNVVCKVSFVRGVRGVLKEVRAVVTVVTAQ